MKPGARFKSAVCQTEVVVVKVPKAAVSLACGGLPMIAYNEPRPGGLAMLPDHTKGTALGKRYADEDSGLEVLCSKAGEGSLSVGGRALIVREAKKLPSSD